ncbi:serine/threonine protein kinase [Pseudobacteriovorax antillogorgiicola]|uniref:non-specific serine/threonine protein kinase n=1 Tax=Pseudobacteriovorax antillogorgiicola TaxID=1513793 RepID=A0A1Y6CS53_9BACT|nr:serine/threonine-protein kinase [Pseudobacteriovorax antillogorgiicola]TCS46101.1 serine/threonine protein kinase [Pseudobacteriovorax antillogorgiicola]SMF69389.1 Serine/threonine protein kinase [Pseudobacteriovorax antillogorgiicola]
MEASTLGNRYRLIEPLGQGGMAVVFRAWDKSCDRFVAIKKIHKHLCEHQGVRGRFQFEAKAISQVEHPNIVKFLDYSGQESKDLWIAMELLEGSDLIDYIDRSQKGYLAPLPAVLIFNDIAGALKEVHRNNIIHRDIKPENIMILHSGHVKLMDFGIARDVHLGNLTQVGDFLGSPNYMSPEQIRGANLDKQADIYSLGVVLFRMLTGQLPFDGQNHHEICMKILLGHYKPPNEIQSGISPILLRIVTRCLALKPEQRYESIEHLLLDVHDFLVLSKDRHFRKRNKTIISSSSPKQRA